MATRHCYKVVDKPLALLAIPKCAASSIIATAQCEPEPMLAHEAQSQGLFVVTFIRHPLDRLVSCWADKINRDFLTPHLHDLGFEAGMSFAAFVELVAEKHNEDHHLRRQDRFVCHRGRWAVDFLGRFEQLDKDWGLVRKMFRLPELTHKNHSPRDQDWRRYYDPDTLLLAQETYRKDLRLFGYR